MRAVVTALLLVLPVLPACAGAAPEIEIEESIEGAYRAPLLDEPCAGEDEDARSARQAISRVRALAGLASLRCDVEVGKAAHGHCEYVVANGELTHVQKREGKRFTGVTFADRMLSTSFAGAPGGEVLANITGGAAILGPNGFLNSVYHRALFLRSEMTSFGYGQVEGCATIDFGRDSKKADDVSVVWPPPGATRVPTTFWSSREVPNPIPGSVAVGSPVSLIRGKALPRLTATLTGPSGVVEATLLTHANDPEKMIRLGEAHLVPLAPLAPHTTYVARFGDVAETTFTTGD